MKPIIQAFAIEGAAVSCERYGNGHINETYLVVVESGRRYILQKINNKVFANVEGLMHNIASVTEYLRGINPDPRSTLHLVPTNEGEPYFGDEETGFWRMYDFVEGSLCLERAQNAEDFRQSAIAFGMFQKQLADFPADTLVETIPMFHNTANRVKQLEEAICLNAANRLDEVRPEIAFAMARAEEAGCMVRMLERGELPLRVTHNDTKLNNVMLDAEQRTPLCVIDLDTVMPGLAANDFGDSIRFGASTGAEDEKDLSKIEMSLELFEVYAQGFLSACGESLTQQEIDTLPMGAKLMTYECGIRFLADYLNGDVYFRTHYPEQNLDRCRTQFKLVADMEAKWEQMQEVIRRTAGAR
ncbi:MAG: aminoglycoside phosphotransferase family protein [Eubacteriales bacterium]|nr:aminoglycoside phosphotransferase family protein [Eubacteriales bacterium]